MSIEKFFNEAPPTASDQEAACLGAMLLDRDAYAIVRDIISPETMYLTSHKIVFEAIDACEREGKPIDILTVTDKLMSGGLINDIGGPHFIVSLTERIASSANIESHARIVREKWMLRKQREMSFEILKMIQSGDPFEILKLVDKSVMRMTDFAQSGEVTLYDAMKAMNISALKRRESGREITGYDLFGIGPLDRAIGGADKGDVINISGRPGEGKTSLVMAIIDECIKVGRPAYFWTPEAHVEKIAAKAASRDTGVPVSDIELGKHLDDPDNSEKLLRESQKLITLRNGSLDIPSMKRRVKNEHQLNGTNLFIFDRAELFDEAARAKSISDVSKAVGDVSQAMRVLANELGDVVFVLVSQLVKEAQGVRPIMSHVYGGTMIQANCTKMVAVFNPHRHGQAELTSGRMSKGMAEVHVLKNNYGSIDFPIELNFDGPTQKWYCDAETIPSNGEVFS